jgi:transposase
MVDEFCMMHLLPSTSKYIFYLGYTDMRKGFDSLSGLVTNHIQSNPLSGDVFIFINRRRTQLKLLRWEGDGFTVYYKRLERGTYEKPTLQNHGSISITYQQLQHIFQGITMKRKYQRKRYQHPSNNC